LSSVTQAGIHAGAGAISGGINAAITESDIGLGILTGGISGGFAKYLGGYLPKGFGYRLAGRAIIGGITSGIASEIYGGSFGRGFRYGVPVAAAGFLFNDWWHDKFLPWAQRVFKGTEKGAGAGIGVKVKILSVGIELEASDLLIDRLTDNGIESFSQERYALQVELFGLKVGLERTNGRFGKVWEYKGISFKEFTTVEVGGTVPHISGAAIHGITRINLNEIW